jgi:hypothetical protein
VSSTTPRAGGGLAGSGTPFANARPTVLPYDAEAKPTVSVKGVGPSATVACIGVVVPTAATTLAAITAAVLPRRLMLVNVEPLPE